MNRASSSGSSTPNWFGRMLALGFLAMAATGFAQDAQPPQPAPSTPAAEAAPQPAVTPTLSPAEQKAQAANYLTEMSGIQRRVSKLAARARDEKDLIKLNCVNDKLVQIRASQTVAEQINQQLSIAHSRGDSGAADHEFSKLTIVYQKVTVLGQEAEACVGEEISYVGQTKVTVQVDPDVDVVGDPTDVPPEPFPTVRPPIASPTQ